MCGRYQHAVAADVYRLGGTADIVWSVNLIMGPELDGKAGPASTFRPVKLLRDRFACFIAEKR